MHVLRPGMTFDFTSSAKTRGSALLVVLWVVALLSFLIITSLMVAMQDVETVGARQVVFRARQLAEMGLAVAAHPLVKRDDPLLSARFSAMETYEARITSEEGRINLNAMLTEERRPVLERMLNQWGISFIDAQALVDRLMDWSDEDEFRRIKGAEKPEYREAGFRDRPFNRAFRSLDEALLVGGMEMLVELKPNWRDYFTLWGGGQLDINEASAEIIALVTDTPPHLAQAIVTQRDGPDGRPYTEDDTPLESVEEAMTLLGLGGDRAALVAPLLTLQGSTVRIESLGRAGDHARGIAVVMQKNERPQVLEWREFVVE
jgi:general secretion pathway protein K